MAADVVGEWLEKDLASGEWAKKSAAFASSVGGSTKTNQVRAKLPYPFHEDSTALFWNLQDLCKGSEAV
jgi:hypothetical protein